MAGVGRKVLLMIISPRPLLKVGSMAAGCSGSHQPCLGSLYRLRLCCLHGKPVPVFNQPHSDLKKKKSHSARIQSEATAQWSWTSVCWLLQAVKTETSLKQKHHCQRCSLLTFCYSKVNNIFSHPPFWNPVSSGLIFPFFLKKKKTLFLTSFKVILQEVFKISAKTGLRAPATSITAKLQKSLLHFSSIQRILY